MTLQGTTLLDHRMLSNILIRLTASLAVLLLSLGGAHSEMSRIQNDRDIFSDVVVCEAYYAFLKDQPVASFDDCDGITRLLIQGRATDPARFAIEYRKNFPTESNFEVLLYAMHNVIFGHKEEAFAVLDIAGRRLFGAFYSAGDVERANIYSILIDRIKLEILSSALPEGSEFLSKYRVVSFEDSFGKEFRILEGRRPDFRLLCLLKSDNLRINVQQVVSSERVRSCVEEFIPEGD